jgi:hypothetical protein
VTNTQTHLPLADNGAEWKLDDRTREIGRRGLAEARAALAEAARRAAAREAARHVVAAERSAA